MFQLFECDVIFYQQFFFIRRMLRISSYQGGLTHVGTGSFLTTKESSIFVLSNTYCIQTELTRTILTYSPYVNRYPLSIKHFFCLFKHFIIDKYDEIEN